MTAAERVGMGVERFGSGWRTRNPTHCHLCHEGKRNSRLVWRASFWPLPLSHHQVLTSSRAGEPLGHPSPWLGCTTSPPNTRSCSGGPSCCFPSAPSRRTKAPQMPPLPPGHRWGPPFPSLPLQSCWLEPLSPGLFDAGPGDPCPSCHLLLRKMKLSTGPRSSALLSN